MQELTIDNNNPLGPLDVNFYGNTNAQNTIIFIDGNPSTKNDASGTINTIIEMISNTNALSFTYRGNCQLCQGVKDISKIIEYTNENIKPKKMILIATSAGAYSVCQLLTTSSRILDVVFTVIFLDPADYVLHTNDYHPAISTWSGIDMYSPTQPTVVSLLKSLNSDIKIHVVNFMLRIIGEDGYVPEKERHIDHHNKFARLNNDMVRAFYENTPEKNRGKYIEDHQLPHAFERDGNLEENRKRVAELILECLE